MALRVEQTQLLAFVLLIVLALALGNLIQALRVLPGSDTGSGRTMPTVPSPPSSPFGISREIVQAILLVIMLVGAISLALGLILAARRTRRTRVRRSAFSNNTFLLTFMIVALGILALLFSRGRGTFSPILGGQHEDAGSAATPSAVPSPNVVALNIPLGLLLLVGALGVLIAVGLIRGASSRAAPPPPGPRREVAQEMARAADLLLEGGDLRGTILRCYVNTCGLLALRGAPADESLTAREFEDRARPILGLSEASLGRLTSLFEVARYSPHPVGPAERDDAVTCLRTIQEELEG